MKKTITILALLAFFAGFSSMALAANSCNTDADDPGDSLEVTDDTNILTFNFSPSVVGCYWTEGATANEQWFAIGTFHVGGDEAYATASNFTSLYTLDGGTEDITKDSATVFAGIVATAGSEGDWTGWSKK